MVDGTLVCLGCLVALDRVARREGQVLGDFLGADPRHAGRDLRDGLSALVARRALQ